MFSQRQHEHERQVKKRERTRKKEPGTLKMIVDRDPGYNCIHSKCVCVRSPVGIPVFSQPKANLTQSGAIRSPRSDCSLLPCANRIICLQPRRNTHKNKEWGEMGEWCDKHLSWSSNFFILSLLTLGSVQVKKLAGKKVDRKQGPTTWGEGWGADRKRERERKRKKGEEVEVSIGWISLSYKENFQWSHGPPVMSCPAHADVKISQIVRNRADQCKGSLKPV